MKKLHEQRLKWRPHDTNSPIWAFVFVNDESPIDVKVPQVMHCILCYNKLVSHAILGQITRVMR